MPGTATLADIEDEKPAGGTATLADIEPDSPTPSKYAKPGPYTTKLPDKDEAGFQHWVQQNKIPWQDEPNADYDMRGYWKAQQSGDPNAKRAENQHFPDTWKTPYHASFSNESMYATPDAPHWEGDNLVPTKPSPVTLNTKRGGSSGVLPPEPSKPSWRDYAGAAWSTITGAEPGAETGISDFASQERSRHLKQAQTPGERATGALGLASDVLEDTTPVMGPAMIENPAAIARGLAEGYAASKAGGYVAKKAGANEEQQQDIESLAMWAPGVARSVASSLGLAEPKVGVQTGPEGTAAGISGSGGTRAGVAVTPEEIRIGGQFKGGTPRSVSIPRRGAAPAQPAIEPQTIEGQVVPPQPTAPHPGAPVDNMAEGASNAVAMANEEAQAMRMVSGLPATPPPLPVPPPPAPPIPKEAQNNHISAEDVQKVGGLIARVPPEFRAQATLEAHQTLSQAIAQQGKFVTPDGKIEIITKPEQAEKVAQRIINDEVKRTDKEAAEKQKESGQKGAAAATTEAAPQKVEPEVQSAHVSEIQEESQTAKLEDIQEPVGRGDSGSVAPATTQPDQQSAGSTGIQRGGQSPANPSVQAAKFQKGDQVVLKEDKTLPDGTLLKAGTKVEVQFPHPTMSIVRVKTADGRKLSLGSKSLTPAGATVSVPVEQNGSQGASVQSPGAGKAEQLRGGVSEGRTPSSDEPQRAKEIPAAVVTPKAEQPAAETTPIPAKTEELAPGKVGEMKVSHLNLSPHEFQYKLGTDAEGVGTLLKETKVFNPDLAGQISVWKNPKNEKFYVVNGHHRYELAKRTGTRTVAVRHIKAKDAVEARAIGAQQNIAEGRGTALDAAKYFRDTGTTAEHLAEKGISLGEATAKNGLALSHLDPAIFNRVVSGDLRPGRAIAIGEATKDAAEQKAILSLVEKKEAKGGKVSDDTLSELIRMVKGSEQTTETTADLFGSREITRSLALEKAEISAHIKQQLAKDKKLFGFVAKADRATELERAGNKIDVEKSKEISTGAAQAEEVYNKLSSRGGPISSILDESARRLADGDNAGTVKSEAYQRVRDEVSKTLGGSEERSTGRSEGTLESQQPSEAGTSEPQAPVEPTLPGMEHVPAERAEATAEQQGKDLTDKLIEPPKSIEATAGEIEQKSPLFRNTEANPQGDMFGELLRGESGSFEPGKIGATVSELVNQDVAPALSKAGINLRDTAGLFLKAFYPRVEESNPVGRWLKAAAPSDAVDELMRLKGDRAKSLAYFDGVMAGLEKMFDRLPDEARVDFIHRIQTGEKQPSLELQQIANVFKQIQDGQRHAEQEAANLGRSAKQAVELSKKENYFHNWWDTPPGKEAPEDEESRVSSLSSPRRPLEGSRGYNKKQSYTLKEGIAAGGKPETTNPVRIMRHRIEDGLKFVTARKAWQALQDLDLRTFVHQGERPPAGFDKVDDRIARVYFPAESGEGPIKAGEWYVESNTARLLNNMLSRDLIRANAAGRSLMWLKNSSTALELGMSPFHAVFETIEAASSQFALGLQRSYNLGFRNADPAQLAKGITEMATAPLAPITMAREGGALPAYIEARSRLNDIGITEFGHPQVEGKQPHGVKEAIAHFGEVRKVAGIKRLLKQYPDLDQLVDDMFTGGLIVGQHRDYQVKAFGKTAAEAWSAGNHLGAILRAGISAPQVVMKPLFQIYIPNLKYSLFLKQMSEQALEHAAELEDGSLTRETLARRVADSVENRFGELNFDNLFLNRTVKTALQFAFRSVTYKLGTAREFAGAAGGQTAELANWARQAYDSEYRESSEAPGKLPRLDQRMSWVFSLLLTTAAMGTIASKLLSGKYPWEWLEDDKADGGGDLRHLYLETVHPRTGDIDTRKKPVRISLPTYFKDVEHLLTSPGNYLRSSFSSTLSKGMDLAENRDYFGNYVYNPHAGLGTKLKQAGKYAFPTPFVVSNYQRGQQMGEPKTAWMSAFGFPRAPSDLDFTPAEKELRKLIQDSRAPATPEQMEEWRAKREAYKAGKLSAAEAKRFIKQERQSFLEREFKNSSVSYTDAVRIHNLATPEEKPLLDRLLRAKRANQLKRYGVGEVQRKEAEAAAQ